MIISVSKRTDIPAFYGEWFLNRLDAGYCMVRNPKGKPYRVSLKREDVDGFVFWTKNISPFMGALATVYRRGYPFYVLYTINNYPKSIEPNVPPAEKSIQWMHELKDKYGPNAAVWRYDPIIVTRKPPNVWHLENFRKLAEALARATNEVVISFADITCYGHVQRNMAGINWLELATEEKITMAGQLASIAKEYGMQLTMCCERGVQPEGTRPSHCVDAGRMGQVALRPIVAKITGTRPGCECFFNRDIGDYDTCLHGCKYCYATTDNCLAKRLHGAHDAHGDMLIPLVEGSDTDRVGEVG
jgi:hypothetical protein